MIKKFNKPLLIFLFAAVISIPVVLPFFHKGYFPTHDGEWAVVRMGDMFRSLRDHQFPARYSGNLNFGYGYPLFNFTYPAPYYAGTAFHFLKFGFVDSVKILFVLSVVLSALSMYFASKRIWGSTVAGVISAVFYVYLPYRIVDLYARGSIGESLSFIFFPLIVYFVLKILDDPKPKIYIVFASVSYAMLIATHNIMAVLFTPVLLVFVLAKIFLSKPLKKSRGYFNVLLFMFLSYGLSAFFWLPALLEKHSILLSHIPIADRNIYFVTIHQLLIPKWGYGLPDHPDGFSYQIGLAHAAVLVILAGLLAFVRLKKRKLFKEFNFKLATVLSLIAVCLISLMFSFTASIWKITPLLKEINYPWTLLALIGFVISLLAGFLWLQNKFVKHTVVVLAVAAVILVLPFAKPEQYFDKGDGYYLTNEATTTSSQELMPLWVNKNPIERSRKKVEVINGKGEVRAVLFDSKSIRFTSDLTSKSVIRINTIYYPGWTIKVDGVPTSISYNNTKGVMDVSVPHGKHQVVAIFGETPMRMVSNGISFASLIMLVFLAYRHSRHGQNDEE